jgi:hypothetical protein
MNRKNGGKSVSDSEVTRYKSFDDVCCLVQPGHQVGNDTPEQTLNRLFRKHLDGLKKHLAANPPWLSSENTIVTAESWGKPALRELAPRESSRVPRQEDLPVVIIRYRGDDCLIDGGSRIHAWHVAGDTGSHPACVVTVTDEEN